MGDETGNLGVAANRKRKVVPLVVDGQAEALTIANEIHPEEVNGISSRIRRRVSESELWWVDELGVECQLPVRIVDRECVVDVAERHVELSSARRIRAHHAVDVTGLVGVEESVGEHRCAVGAHGKTDVLTADVLLMNVTP